MSYRARLMLAFAAVALGTAALVAVVTPSVLGGGFQRYAGALASAEPSGGGPGHGPRPGAGPAAAAAVEQETTQLIVLAALGAAVVASVGGFLAADRLVRPLRRLQIAAAGVAGGDLGRRSGLAGRHDEVGELGRSFDAMASELEAAEVSRRHFLQDAVHELRTPLTVIDSTATAIIEGVYPPEARHLGTIQDQARLMARLVDDLRTISLAEARALPLHRQRLSVADLMEATAEAFRVRAAGAGQAISVAAPADLAVEGDADRLRQALAALVDNAIRHTPAGGSIELRGERLGGAVRLLVEDTGPGIDADALPHVFERFFQADPSRDRTRGTSGLGLAIVQALAQAHGGEAVAANRPTGGASFELRLPAA